MSEFLGRGKRELEMALAIHLRNRLNYGLNHQFV
jgi:hypothetical protein